MLDHETRDSNSLISYADCLGQSPCSNFCENTLFKCAWQPKIAKKNQ